MCETERLGKCILNFLHLKLETKIYRTFLFEGSSTLSRISGSMNL